MAYLIDSDWTIDHLKQDPTAQELIASLTPEGVHISIVTYMEAFQGTLRQDNPALQAAQLQTFTITAPVLSLTISIVERCARIRQHLLDQGQRPTRRGLDLLIAATALEYNLVLVTRNVRDYADVPGISLYETLQA